MKKVAIFVLIIMLALMLCSCRLYVHKEDTGKYYLYENNVKTDTWIEFKDNQAGWVDSEGNHGSVRGSDGDYFLYANGNAPPSDENLVYRGWFFHGTFSFYKIGNEIDGNICCRNFYSSKSQVGKKDSTLYTASTIVYSVELQENQKPTMLYSFIRYAYASMGYPPIITKNVEDFSFENGKWLMRFVVSDCEETRAFSAKIANVNPEETFLVKDENGDIVLTAKDFLGETTTMGLLRYSVPVVEFHCNQEGGKRAKEWLKENPSGTLKLYLFGEYAQDVSIIKEGNSMWVEDIKITGSNAALVAKDVLLTQWDKTLSVVE